MAADLSSAPLPPAPQPADLPRPVDRTPRPLPGSAGASGGRSFTDELASSAAAPAAAPRASAKASEGGESGGKGAAATDNAQRQALLPLKRAAQANKREVDGAPVVAFLSGHLERLQPGQIPDLVSGNRFLGNALSDGDLNQFLAKPMAIADLLKALDLPADLAEQAEKLGLDPNVKVSPSELLRAIGLDPQRVFAELKVLKDNIALDGVAGYVARASALTGKDPTRRELAAAPGAPMDPGPAARAMASAAPLSPSFDPSTLQPAPPLPAPGKMPLPSVTSVAKTREGGVADAGGPGAESLTPAAILALMQGLGTRTAGAVEGAAAPGPEARVDLGPTSAAGGIDPVLERLLSEGRRALPDPDPAAPNLDAAPAADAAATASKAAPSAAKATFDAFASLGDRLKGAATDRVSFGAEAAAATVPAAAPVAAPATKDAPDRDASDLVAKLTAGIGAANARGPAAPVIPLRPGVTAPLSQPAAVAGAPAPAVDPRLSQPQTLAAAAPAQAPASPVGLTDLVEALQHPAARPLPGNQAQLLDAKAGSAVATVTAVGGKRGSEAGSNPDAGTSGDQSQQRRDDGRGTARNVAPDKTLHDLLALRHAGGINGAGKSFAAHVSEAGTMSPAERATLMQQVIDRASYLAKAGGGTVRLDLGSPQLGHLEMAVNMQGDRLDLRVLAGSERVKEAMMGDLAQLRSALSVQNVQLGHVEVGTQRQPHQGGFAFGGQQQWQQQQQQQQQQFAQRQPQLSRPASPADIRPVAPVARPFNRVQMAAAMADTYRGNGRIAVRA